MVAAPRAQPHLELQHAIQHVHLSPIDELHQCSWEHAVQARRRRRQFAFRSVTRRVLSLRVKRIVAQFAVGDVDGGSVPEAFQRVKCCVARRAVA